MGQGGINLTSFEGFYDSYEKTEKARNELKGHYRRRPSARLRSVGGVSVGGIKTDGTQGVSVGGSKSAANPRQNTLWRSAFFTYLLTNLLR